MADILDLDVQQEDMAIDEAGGEDEGNVVNWEIWWYLLLIN